MASWVEVKGMAKLSATQQLRGMVAYAQGQGVPLEIFTNASLPSAVTGNGFSVPRAVMSSAASGGRTVEPVTEEDF